MADDLALARLALANDPEGLRSLNALVDSLPVSDDARQALRQRVLVEGRLREFDGRGSLRSWLKTVAVRLEVDLKRMTREDAVEVKVLDALIPPSVAFESELVAAEARGLIRSSLKSSLEALPDRDRLWIQHYHLDGMTLTAIGKLYGVAPSTVMRAIDRTLQGLRATVLEHLRSTHRLGLASLESLVRQGVS